ncbi:Tex13b [Phodopus roborovskii]|uniref:Tex13b protein n=1 Tax=Phodopus roborovskii TaxID=109678 RepID=A0AAU9YWL2_PHORO|nr:Tex13b [Phodopus roborovskii]
MNPEDPGNGFRHGKVLMFINEQMSKHTKGPEFYVENVSLSWEEVEEKLRLLLEDSEMTKEAQEACAWSSLALGVRFAWRQGHLQGRRVQWLHDFACLHRSAAHALASDLKKLTDQQEMERKEAAFQLQLAHTKLAEVQRERDLMRLKLLHARFVTPMRTPRDCGECQHQMQARTSVTVQPFNRTPWSPVGTTMDRSEQESLLV